MRGREVFAVVVVESSRRGDVRDVDVSRWHDQLQSRADEVECAAVDAADVRAYRTGVATGGGFALDVDDPDAALWLNRLRQVSRSSSDVLIVGELGSGKRTAARCLHHMRTMSGRVGDLRTVPCFGLDGPALHDRLVSQMHETILLADIEALDGSAQAVLAEWLARPKSERARCLATAPSGATLQHPDLASALQRVMLHTEPFRMRRHWIPRIAQSMLGRIAAVEGREAPGLDEVAEMQLWRQGWAANGAELEAVLYRALITQTGVPSGAPLREGDIQSALRGCSLPVINRLPSRDPSARDLASAAWWTRTASGRINRSRAAAALGWDPATLKARLKAAEMETLPQVAAVLSSVDSVTGVS